MTVYSCSCSPLSILPASRLRPGGRELAVQWAWHRIRVNAIAPGFFRTDQPIVINEGSTAR